MISKTHIKQKATRKTNPALQEAVMLARKNTAWLPIAHRITGPTNRATALNLDQIDKQTKAGDTVFVPGKVLASGQLTKKVRIVALGFSATAKKQILAVKGEPMTLLEEMKANPKMNGVKVLQ